jgi:hypothetical protein
MWGSWVVVLPIELDTRRPPRFELVVYQSPKVSLWNGGRSSPGSHAAGFCNVRKLYRIGPLRSSNICLTVPLLPLDCGE